MRQILNLGMDTNNHPIILSKDLHHPGIDLRNTTQDKTRSDQVSWDPFAMHFYMCQEEHRRHTCKTHWIPITRRPSLDMDKLLQPRWPQLTIHSHTILSHHPRSRSQVDHTVTHRSCPPRRDDNKWSPSLAQQFQHHLRQIFSPLLRLRDSPQLPRERFQIRKTTIPTHNKNVARVTLSMLLAVQIPRFHRTREHTRPEMIRLVIHHATNLTLLQAILRLQTILLPTIQLAVLPRLTQTIRADLAIHATHLLICTLEGTTLTTVTPAVPVAQEDLAIQMAP